MPMAIAHLTIRILFRKGQHSQATIPAKNPIKGPLEWEVIVIAKQDKMPIIPHIFLTGDNTRYMKTGISVDPKDPAVIAILKLPWHL